MRTYTRNGPESVDRLLRRAHWEHPHEKNNNQSIPRFWPLAPKRLLEASGAVLLRSDPSSSVLDFRLWAVERRRWQE